jgi:hypothetical protein
MAQVNKYWVQSPVGTVCRKIQLGWLVLHAAQDDHPLVEEMISDDRTDAAGRCCGYSAIDGGAVE